MNRAGSREVHARGRLQLPREELRREWVHVDVFRLGDGGRDGVGSLEVELGARLHLRDGCFLRLGHRPDARGFLTLQQQVPGAHLHLSHRRLLLRGETRDVEGVLLLGGEGAGKRSRRWDTFPHPRVGTLASLDAFDASSRRAASRGSLDLQNHRLFALVEPGEVRHGLARVDGTLRSLSR